MAKRLVRWFVCRAGWWNNSTRRPRHDFAVLPGTEAEIYRCRRCDYQIGF